MARKSLIAQVERDALDPRSDLPSLLRKCIALGGETGSVALRDWATLELKGYQGAENLPDYRRASAPLQFDGSTMRYSVTGQMLPATFIPEFAQNEVNENIEFRQPVAEILEMIRDRRHDEPIRWGVPGQSLLLPLINSQELNGHVERIYWSVSPTTARRVLDVVRTVLVEMLAEMRAGTPKGAAIPSAEIADQAVNLAVRGFGHRVVVNNAPGASGAITTTVGGRTSTGSAEPEPRWRAVMLRLGGLATIAAAVIAAISQWG